MITMYLFSIQYLVLVQFSIKIDLRKEVCFTDAYCLIPEGRGDHLSPELEWWDEFNTTKNDTMSFV